MSESNGKTKKKQEKKTNKQKRFSLFLMSNYFIHEALSDVYTNVKKCYPTCKKYSWIEK